MSVVAAMNEWLVVLAMSFAFLVIGFVIVVIGFAIWWAAVKTKIRVFGEPPAIKRG